MKKKLNSFVGFDSHVFPMSNRPIFTFNAMLRQPFLIFICLLIQIFTFANDSSHLRIALLTCTPGEDLYSTFGHTGIRVTDSIDLKEYDNVFNYGSFNFDDPGFYTKFIRGKLLYYLSVEHFQDFKAAYKAENRGITEQVLNMTGSEKITLMEALYENAKEENKYYKYDFFLDNCTTRARDILVKYIKSPPAFKPVMPEGIRFRQAIHQYLDKNEKYWSKLGIDLLLGVPTDAVMTLSQTQFLPDNLMKSFNNSNQDRSLVLSSTNLYEINPVKHGSFFTPKLIFSSLLVLIVLLSFSPNMQIKSFLQGFDGLLFFITGMLGILLVFMWFGTDHSMTKNNYNLLWAWPTNAIVAFFVNSKKKSVKIYFAVSTVALILVLLSWSFLPQELNSALIYIVLLLTFRSGFRYVVAHR